MVFEKLGRPADLSEDYGRRSLNAFYAVSYAPSSSNRQPTRPFDQDTGKVMLVRLPDSLITETDARLGSGAAPELLPRPLRPPSEKKWTLGKPGNRLQNS